MIRSLVNCLALGLILLLSGCGGPGCESVQNQIEEIGRQIQENPEKAIEEETLKSLEGLRNELEELGCSG
jgi:hypothetical protein